MDRFEMNLAPLKSLCSRNNAGCVSNRLSYTLVDSRNALRYVPNAQECEPRNLFLFVKMISNIHMKAAIALRYHYAFHKRTDMD